MHNSTKREHVSYIMLLISALIGLTASFVLSVEAIALAENPDVVLACSVNDVVNCAAVGLHESASIFGFPNAFVGMMTLPVMVTIAVGGLMKVKYSRLFIFGGMVGAILGAVFAIWMLYTSFFVIQILCPWCLTLDIAMIGILLAMFRLAVDHHALYVAKPTQKKLEQFSKKSYDIMIAVAVIVIIAAAIIIKYGSSF